MAVERNHRMDELLRTYAQKRRDQAGPPMPMPPETRAFLRTEVERTFRGPAPVAERELEAGFSLASFWRRVLLGGAGVALVLVAAGTWFKVEHAKETKLASVRESNLLLFAESATPRALPPGALPPGGIPSGGFGGGGFGNAVDDRLGVAAGIGGQVLKQEEPLGRGEPMIKGVRRLERVDIAAAAPPRLSRAEMEEMVSNAPRWQFELPAQAGSSSQARGRAPEPAKPALAEQVPGGPAQPAAPAPALAAPVDASLETPADAPLLTLRATPPDAAVQLGRGSSEALVDRYGGLQQDEPVAEVKEVALARESNAIEQAGRPLAPSIAALDAKSADSLAAAPAQNYANNLYFQQVEPERRYRRNLNSPPTPKVLPTFEVQQIGTNVRIVDWDKSVYEGTLLAAPAETTPTAQQAYQNFQFKAAGTNVTLNQLVVFTGNLESPGGPPAVQPTGVSFTTTPPASAQPSSQALVLGDQPTLGRFFKPKQLPRAKIEGNAVIGENQLRIEAYEISPQ